MENMADDFVVSEHATNAIKTLNKHPPVIAPIVAGFNNTQLPLTDIQNALNNYAQASSNKALTIALQPQPEYQIDPDSIKILGSIKYVHKDGAPWVQSAGSVLSKECGLVRSLADNRGAGGMDLPATPIQNMLENLEVSIGTQSVPITGNSYWESLNQKTPHYVKNALYDLFGAKRAGIKNELDTTAAKSWLAGVDGGSGLTLLHLRNDVGKADLRGIRADGTTTYNQRKQSVNMSVSAGIQSSDSAAPFEERLLLDVFSGYWDIHRPANDDKSLQVLPPNCGLTLRLYIRTDADKNALDVNVEPVPTGTGKRLYIQFTDLTLSYDSYKLTRHASPNLLNRIAVPGPPEYGHDDSMESNVISKKVVDLRLFTAISTKTHVINNQTSITGRFNTDSSGFVPDVLIFFVADQGTFKLNEHQNSLTDNNCLHMNVGVSRRAIKSIQLQNIGEYSRDSGNFFFNCFRNGIVDVDNPEDAHILTRMKMGQQPFGGTTVMDVDGCIARIMATNPLALADSSIIPGSDPQHNPLTNNPPDGNIFGGLACHVIRTNPSNITGRQFGDLPNQGEVTYTVGFPSDIAQIDGVELWVVGLFTGQAALVVDKIDTDQAPNYTFLPNSVKVVGTTKV